MDRDLARLSILVNRILANRILANRILVNRILVKLSVLAAVLASMFDGVFAKPIGGFAEGSRNKLRVRRRYRRNRGGFADICLPLHVSHFIFYLNAEVVGDTPEVGHGLAHYAGHLRQLFGSKDNQRHEEDYHQMGDAQHTSSLFDNLFSKK